MAPTNTNTAHTASTLNFKARSTTASPCPSAMGMKLAARGSDATVIRLYDALHSHTFVMQTPSARGEAFDRAVKNFLLVDFSRCNSNGSRQNSLLTWPVNAHNNLRAWP